MLDRNSPIPLYYQLADELKQQMESGIIKPGDKLPSESEMIKQYDIGRLTVRMALSQLVNQGYLEKIHGKGTFCRTAHIGEEPMNIDVILDMADTYFIPYYMKSISEVLTECNCNFIVSDSRDSTQEITLLLRRILEKGTSGVILQPSHIQEEVPAELEECFQQYRSAGIPYIMIDSVYEGIDTSYTILDEKKGGGLVARYLAGLGHTRTLVVYVDRYKDSLLRVEGFKEATRLLSMEAPPLLPYRRESFGTDLLRALEKEEPTAVFCYNDDMAAECMAILREHHVRVPEDLSVVGFDDSVLSAASLPPLTTVAHPKQIMGELAARVLLELIRKNRPWPYVNVFDPRLIERDSCAGPKCGQ